MNIILDSSKIKSWAKSLRVDTDGLNLGDFINLKENCAAYFEADLPHLTEADKCITASFRQFYLFALININESIYPNLNQCWSQIQEQEIELEFWAIFELAVLPLQRTLLDEYESFCADHDILNRETEKFIARARDFRLALNLQEKVSNLLNSVTKSGFKSVEFILGLDAPSAAHLTQALDLQLVQELQTQRSDPIASMLSMTQSWQSMSPELRRTGNVPFFQSELPILLAMIDEWLNSISNGQSYLGAKICSVGIPPRSLRKYVQDSWPQLELLRAEGVRRFNSSQVNAPWFYNWVTEFLILLDPERFSLDAAPENFSEVFKWSKNLSEFFPDFHFDSYFYSPTTCGISLQTVNTLESARIIPISIANKRTTADGISWRPFSFFLHDLRHGFDKIMRQRELEKLGLERFYSINQRALAYDALECLAVRIVLYDSGHDVPYEDRDRYLPHALDSESESLDVWLQAAMDKRFYQLQAKLENPRELQSFLPLGQSSNAFLKIGYEQTYNWACELVGKPKNSRLVNLIHEK